MLVDSNQPWWAYLHHRNWQMLQMRVPFFLLVLGELLNIYQCITGYRRGQRGVDSDRIVQEGCAKGGRLSCFWWISGENTSSSPAIRKFIVQYRFWVNNFHIVTWVVSRGRKEEHGTKLEKITLMNDSSCQVKRKKHQMLWPNYMKDSEARDSKGSGKRLQSRARVRSWRAF